MTTPEYKYSANESLERIYNILIGINPNDQEGFLGQQAWERSLSLIAQLLEGSLTDTFLDEDFNRKYGSIWSWSGTATITGLSAKPNYTKITGSFQNAGVSSSTAIVAQPTQDRLLITDVGNYLIHWSVSYEGDPNSEYAIEPYVNGIGCPQAVARSTPSSSGTSKHMSGVGIEYVSGTSIVVALYVEPTLASAWIKPRTTSLVVQRIGKAKGT